MKRRLQKQLIFLLFLLFSLTLLQNFIRQRSKASLLQTDTCFTEKFRQQALPPSLYAKLEKVQKEDSPKSFADLLTSTMLHGDFYPDKLSTDNEPYLQFKPEDYYLLKSLYAAIWSDLETFPVPQRASRDISREIYYENTFGAARTFGGDRKHEGCDLFGVVSRAGFYPVISMTAGTVENIGWLPLGATGSVSELPAADIFIMHI